jgi:D-sedoheptulose 7-phosphate isomerase
MISPRPQTIDPQTAKPDVAEPQTVGLAAGYLLRLSATASSADWSGVEQLAGAIHRCAREQRQVFLCGNGGSAANALHLATDLMFGISKNHAGGLRAIALPGNPSLVTCLANDLGYERIFSAQLAVQARSGDLLIALSGSGNSPNILHVLDQAKAMGVQSFAILGYSGGAAKPRADVAIHFAVDDMQISEDLQLIAGHMIMQWMMRNPPVSEPCA